MRPSHQNNKRMRGRNRGGKGPNPLSRTYESNGPDVKIRGTAQHIAEKYLQLARDAQASGDPVTAESYLQHAEHYLRLIAAAHEQLRQQNPAYRPYEPGADLDQDDMDEEGGPYLNGTPQPDVRFPQGPGEAEGEYQPRPFPGREQGPREPRGEFQPREGREYQPREGREFQPREPRDQQPREFQPREGRGEFQGRRDDRFGRRGPRPDRQDRQEQPRFDRQERGERQDRPERGERPERAERPERGERAERAERPERAERQERAERPVEAEQAVGLPAFITAPVRTPASEPVEEAPQAATPAPAEAAQEESFPVRPRRRRTTRARTATEPAAADEAASE